MNDGASGMSTASIRLVMVDDDPEFLAVYRRLLAGVPDIDLVGAAGTAAEGVRTIQHARADVALLDAQLPDGTGIDAIARIDLTRTRVLVLTTFDLDEYIVPALRAGASGFLLKTASPREVVSAVRAAARGDAALAPEITRRLLDTYASRPTGEPNPLAAAHLTPRELDIVRLVAGGLSNRQIAAELHVSTETVRTHLKRIFARTDLSDRTQLAVAAHRAGLLRD